jgi:pimeloyl-ACP methyl ester carboxylesterase
MSSTSAADSYINSENRRIEAESGTTFAYRDLGSGDVPLVLLQHFRGNLDSWDPALVDALAENRRIVTFDNTGVGGSTGTTPHTIDEMAGDAHRVPRRTGAR